MEIDREEDDEDDTLGGFIVPDNEEDDDDFGKSVSKKKPKQPNRAIIQDSDDEEQAQQSEAEEEPAPRKNKGKGKQKEKPVYELKFIKEVRWASFLAGPFADVTVGEQQEPSTKMIWAEKEVERMLKENTDGAFPLRSLPLPARSPRFPFRYRQGHHYLVVRLRPRHDGHLPRVEGSQDGPLPRRHEHHRARGVDQDPEEVEEVPHHTPCVVIVAIERSFPLTYALRPRSVSLKCGGVGLTLTRANRVISLGTSRALSLG